jgi:hypothetical protein
MVHEPVHIVHLLTAHSVNFFEFQIIVHNIYPIYVINIIVHVYLIIYLNLPYTWFRVELNTWTVLIYKSKVRKWTYKNNYEFWLSLYKIVRSSVILLLPLFLDSETLMGTCVRRD